MLKEQLEDGQQGSVLSNTAEVKFAQFSDRAVQGKVDTGATTSSLHAERITINREQGTVTFYSKALSDNMITLELDGAQEVHSADGGGQTRPMIKLDVSVDGTPVQGAVFNLNDRGNMDSDVLIGQNILKAGKFTIDPSRPDPDPEGAVTRVTNGMREAAILAAVEVLSEHDVSFSEIVRYMRTVAVNQIKE